MLESIASPKRIPISRPLSFRALSERISCFLGTPSGNARLGDGQEPPARQSEVRSYLVFISHSSADIWIAEQIDKQIRALGAATWLDKNDLKGGDVLVDEIINGIASCNEAVVLVSPKSVKSQWVAYEIGAVSVQRKRVTPILNQVNPDAIAPMKGVKSIDLNQFDEFLIQLAKRITEWSKTRR